MYNKDITKKRQHFVPKFYLKNFSSEKGGRRKKHLTWSFDKSTGKSNVRNINDVALEKYFNDMIRGDNVLENKLGKFENDYKRVLKKLITEKDLSLLSNDDKKMISHLIVTQFVRTREMRELVIRMDQLRYENNITKEYNGLSPKFQHLGFIYYTINEYVNDFKLSPFLKMKWGLMINNTELDYWTSDNPVNIYNNVRNRYFTERGEKYIINIGLIDEGVEIYYPITPKLCLSLVDSKYYPNLSSETNIEINNVKHIKDINRLQVLMSGKEIYSKNDDFSIAIDMLNEYPQFKGNIWNLIKNSYPQGEIPPGKIPSGR